MERFTKLNRTKIYLLHKYWICLHAFLWVIPCFHNMLTLCFAPWVKLLENNVNIYLKLTALKNFSMPLTSSTMWSQRCKIYSSPSEIFLFLCLWPCTLTSNALPPFLISTASLLPWLPTSVVLSYPVFSVVPYLYVVLQYAWYIARPLKTLVLSLTTL